jgi:uncharacterized protein
MSYPVNMIKRHIAPLLKKAASQYPVITLTGPRQSGKTTACHMVFPKMNYISLEDHDTREFAISDPRRFLETYSNGIIIDEIQHAPNLPSYIQGVVDRVKKNGQFILTGSENLKLSQTINQSLAGRTSVLKLLPFSVSEIKKEVKDKSVDEILYTGFYPRIYDQNLEPRDALNNYIETYVERDIRNISQIHGLGLFQKFLKLCAGRVGQILNVSNLGNEVGISHSTAREWLSLLQATYIVTLLTPYYKNFNKRVIKSPKLYFYDVGLAANLLGIKSPEHISRDPLRGALFENMIVMNYLKEQSNRGERESLHYFRDSKHNEVDLLIEVPEGIHAIEIKSAETIASDFSKGLHFFESVCTDKLLSKSVVYGGKGKQIRSWGAVLPFRSL